ncbi:hypothetical protein J8I29_21725 [Labrys sp. LIt4]|uniref:hypothetical protein n=1 Tax=Labrys sp. LIt4 TaxID=2821355 RepID=UPI001AE00065|nr:hypothetical protein [Labrys sp. LIt4]MBP0581963.1 hypothetical protein [Labrys sp. LIt4]
MTGELSDRLRAILEVLPLRPGLRVLESGCRPGALDGRHPVVGAKVRLRLAGVLTPEARLFIGRGDPLREVWLDPSYTSACNAGAR